MDIADARRFIRHVALPEVGSEGQRRISEATVALVIDPDETLVIESVALYLACAGVKKFRLLLTSDVQLPSLGDMAPAAAVEHVRVDAAGSSWAHALADCTAAVRASLADDSFVEACRRVRVPAVVAVWRPSEQAVELLSLRPAPGLANNDVPSVPPSPRQLSVSLSPVDRGAQVFAGTLAATEVLWCLVGRSFLPPGEAAATSVIRHLNVPFSMRQDHPITHNIPWPSA